MREFNITGKIIPANHYFVDLTPQLEKLMALADKGAYFVINRPRQFGKTTILDFFARQLQASGNYAPALISFESFTQRADITEAEFYLKVAKQIFEELTLVGIERVLAPVVNNRDDFFDWARETCKNLPRKLVLLIDEIDAVPETVVIGFLAGLREMYLQRDRKPAPHSVGLVGVHDIKNLKARIRDESQALGSASPFNIAVDYDLPPFSRENIRQYFSQHTAETGQAFADEVISRVHHVTNGHPWLVSVLAKTSVETIAPDRQQKILPEHAEAAIQKLISSRNPNFESLFRNARQPGIFPIVLDLLVNGKGWTFKEVQSGEGRIDVMCCYKNQKEVVELKLWYGERGYEKGLEQLAGYLESESLNRGYLVVFDRRDNAQKEYAFSEHEVHGKKIQAWVI